MSQPLLKACVSKTRRDEEKSDVYILQNVNITINSGDIIMLRGQSGSGKSTLLKILGGLDEPCEGFVCWDQNPIYTKHCPKEKCKSSCDCNTNYTNNSFGNTPIDVDTERAKKISFIFQDPNLIDHISAIDNVALPLIMRGEHNKDTIRQKAEKNLNLVGLGRSQWSRPVGDFSGGMKQRVNIARAFAAEPDIILADEPFSNLDEEARKEIWQAIRQIKINEKKSLSAKKLTMIVVTHEEDLFCEQDIYSPEEQEPITTHQATLGSKLNSKWPFDDQLAIMPKRKPTPRKPTGQPRPCPTCNKGLSQERIGNVWVDICQNCKGLWLDDGELRELMLQSNSFAIQLVEKQILDIS